MTCIIDEEGLRSSFPARQSVDIFFHPVEGPQRRVVSCSHHLTGSICDAELGFSTFLENPKQLLVTVPDTLKRNGTFYCHIEDGSSVMCQWYTKEQKKKNPVWETKLFSVFIAAKRKGLHYIANSRPDKITSDYTTKGPPETQDHSDIPAVFTTVLVAIAILVTVIFVIWMYYRKTKHCTDLKHCCSANSTYIPAVITTLLVAIAVLAIAIVPISTKNRKRSIPDVITAVLVAIAVLPVIWMCIRKRTELVLMLNRIFYPDSLVKRTIEGKQDGSNTPLPLERCRTGT